jgi:hypothetical protein
VSPHALFTLGLLSTCVLGRHLVEDLVDPRLAESGGARHICAAEALAQRERG